MNATLAPGASLRRIAEIVCNAVLFGPDAWPGGSIPERDASPTQRQSLLPSDHDVVELFTLLEKRRIPYLLVGGIALLRYVEGRNTEVIDLLISLPALPNEPVTLSKYDGSASKARKPLRRQTKRAYDAKAVRNTSASAAFAFGLTLKACQTVAGG